MPPKKKYNGFMMFVFEWKDKYGKTMNMQQATTEAGRIWAGMSAQERGPYNTRAKNEKISSQNQKEKLTCTGVPVSVVENERLQQEQKVRSMKKNTERMVRDSLKRNELAEQEYYFVMFNFFTKTLHESIYLPAEVSICKYSLKEGIIDNFHAYINPGITIYGHAFEAQQHSDDTHLLPLPPNSIGEEDLAKVYDSLLAFLPTNANGEYPPLFTHVKAIPIVESCLHFIRSAPQAKDVELKIYSIHYLFFALKEGTCEVGENAKPASSYITDAYFDRDIFEYMTGIACSFHEENDKSNYCTLSCVKRWAYAFSEYMLNDLAIKPILGRHLPINTLSQPEEIPQSSKRSETESCISEVSQSTYATKALSEHKVVYEDPKSACSSHQALFTKEDFPNLLPRGPKKSRTAQATEFNSLLDKDDESEVNRWASRSRQMPPQPDKSDFTIDVTKDANDLNDIDDLSSVASCGRGRIFLSGFGRGKPFSK